MKKKNLMATLGFISAACMIFGSTMINASANDSDKRYANLFSYDAETLSVQENYSLESKGLDAGRSGLLVTSKKTGNEAEGAKLSYNGVMSGAFEMDFRVFSEKSYEAKDSSKTYTHTAIGWDSNNLGNSINYYMDDTFNAYLDLKEVGIKFTSTLDTSKWFTVYVRGGYAAMRADLTSARVETSADNPDWPYALKGYGLVGNNGWPYASWEEQKEAKGTSYTMLGSSFSNTNIAGASPSTMIKFDPATMSVYGYNGGWGLVRDLAGNTGLRTFNDWFGSLDASYFTYGYTVDVTFTDVTANNTVGTSLADSDAGYNNVADAGYKAFDAAYDRYANMVIYSFGGTTLNDSGPTVKVTDSAATIDGVTLDGTKFDNSNAVHLTTTKTGDEAEGTKFYVNETFNDTFEMDFRVFSQKNYTPKDASKTYTHTAIGWNSKNVGNSINYYKDDVFNPYLDLKEVGIKFTSATDSSKWFIVYVRGGYADLRADMASARVYTSTDNPDWPYALKGYGLVGGDGWPYASWDTNVAKGCSYTMIGSSFSNTYINGESPSTMIKFDPTSMTVFGYNGGWGAIRDLAGNSGLHTYNDGTWFGTLSAADFAGGYTVEIEFTDMTSNTTAGNSIVDSDVGYNNVADAAYQPFTDTYARYANMYVYGIKSGDVTLDNANLISTDFEAKQPTVNVDYNKVVTDGQSIDVTPVVYDVNLGNIAYSGTVTWMNLSDETTGEIVANEGKYVFTPASNGTYLIFYSSMTAENIVDTDSFAVIVEAKAHAYGEWIQETAASLATPGVKGHYACGVCGKYFDAEYNEITDIAIPALEGITDMSISTAGDIGLNYYVYLNAKDGIQTATFTVGDETVGSANGVYIADMDRWVFSYGVAPKDYEVEVTISVDGTTVTGAYSVKAYKDALPVESPAYALVEALVAYCESAKTYFNDKDSAVATNDLTAEQLADLATYVGTVSGSDEDITLVGATLVCESVTTIHAYFRASSEVAATVNGAELVEENLYVVKVQNIAAKDLATTYTITIGGYTITYSALAYVNTVVTQMSENVALCNVAKAIYNLSVLARNYW